MEVEMSATIVTARPGSQRRRERTDYGGETVNTATVARIDVDH
jgi:hypothetical protein